MKEKVRNGKILKNITLDGTSIGCWLPVDTWKSIQENASQECRAPLEQARWELFQELKVPPPDEKKLLEKIEAKSPRSGRSDRPMISTYIIEILQRKYS